MAQQTQIDRVAVYWARWMARFPTVFTLAAAPLDDVLALWAGLGYYSRARLVHRAAAEIVGEHGGTLPADPDALRALPGIGPYTAGAIASIAYDRPVAAVDGNVARVLARVFAFDDDLYGSRGQATLWRLAGALVPKRRPGDFNQALFDLGATVCTPRSPACPTCPVAPLCAARASGRELELPRPKKRAAVRAVSVDVAHVVRGDAWLVGRRAPQGLYGGLWELPELAALGPRVEVVSPEPIAEHVQTLSHRTLTIRVLAARLARGGAVPPPAPPYDQLAFSPPDARAQLGISSATAALFARLSPDHLEGASNPSCRTAKKPTRSSKPATRTSWPA